MKKTAIKIICSVLVVILLVPMMTSCDIIDFILGNRSIVKKSMTDLEKAEIFIDEINSWDGEDYYGDSKYKLSSSTKMTNGEIESNIDYKAIVLTLGDTKEDYKLKKIENLKTDEDDDFYFISSDTLIDGKLYVQTNDTAFYSDMDVDKYNDYYNEGDSTLNTENFNNIKCTYNSDKLYVLTLSEPTDEYRDMFFDSIRGNFGELVHFLNIESYEITITLTPSGYMMSYEGKYTLKGKPGTSYNDVTINSFYETTGLQIDEDDTIEIPEDIDTYKELDDALIINRVRDVRSKIINIKSGQIKFYYDMNTKGSYVDTYKSDTDDTIDFKMLNDGDVEFNGTYKYLDNNGYTTIDYEYSDGVYKTSNDSKTTEDYSQEDAYLEIFAMFNDAYVDDSNFTDYSETTSDYSTDIYITCVLSDTAVSEYINEFYDYYYDGKTVNNIEFIERDVVIKIGEDGIPKSIIQTINVKVNNSVTIYDKVAINYINIGYDYCNADKGDI